MTDVEAMRWGLSRRAGSDCSLFDFYFCHAGEPPPGYRTSTGKDSNTPEAIAEWRGMVAAAMLRLRMGQPTGGASDPKS
jgi:hypothetical protein